jgi:hypothetical protein
MPITYGGVSSGDQVNYTGSITGYGGNPGTVQPDWGDGLVRILWADGWSLSVLPADHPMLADLEQLVP